MTTECTLPSLCVWLPHRSTRPHLQWGQEEETFFFFFFSIFGHATYEILVPQPGIETMDPALEVWSLNHSTTRKVPEETFWDFPFTPSPLGTVNLAHPLGKTQEPLSPGSLPWLQPEPSLALPAYSKHHSCTLHLLVWCFLINVYIPIRFLSMHFSKFTEWHATSCILLCANFTLKWSKTNIEFWWNEVHAEEFRVNCTDVCILVWNALKIG